MGWKSWVSWTWDSVISSYQDSLKHAQRRFIISWIFPVIKTNYHIEQWDDAFLDEIISWKRLPEIDLLVFRDLTIIVTDILADPVAQSWFQIIQNSKRMLELIPYLKTLSSLSSAKMFVSHGSFLSIYLSGTRGFGLDCYCEQSNLYGFYDIVGKGPVYAELLSCHDLSDLLHTITSYSVTSSSRNH